MAAQVRATIAQPAGDGALFGSKFQEECAAAVGRCCLLLRQRQQFVRNRNTGNLSRVKITRRGGFQHVNIGQHWHAQAAGVHILQQFVLLARVVANLVNDEARPHFDLARQLEILRHHLALVPLEVRHYGAGKELRIGLG